MEQWITDKKDPVVNSAFTFNLNKLDRLDIPYVSLKIRNLFFGKSTSYLLHNIYILYSLLCEKVIRAQSV